MRKNRLFVKTNRTSRKVYFIWKSRRMSKNLVKQCLIKAYKTRIYYEDKDNHSKVLEIYCINSNAMYVIGSDKRMLTVY